MTSRRRPEDTIRQWWQSRLRPEHQPGIGEDNAAAQALRARLLRAGQPSRILAEPTVHEFSDSLPFFRSRPFELARLVQVLAAVKCDSRTSLAGLLGRKAENDRPTMSELRFQKLIRGRGAEIGDQIRRALKMTDGTCRVSDLARALLDWDDPDHGETIRTRWCFDYYGAERPPSVALRTEDNT